ncbi:tRNA ligase [Spathaspora passalidarum NRRL Y-27907]|uniref:tRNA ligase n=1 Tax=Spathaspora passalidarum (strain NRRL Y-27907 / 11-Y1) TaxID=619300 RepID=G3AVE7_SPAPN|nr:tRNA ligase [Spathaspora passalidarum NRRL Y-27907]EGW30166.1 tRNA ligase [Spathaspora passalidarum NRRL Y-27907]
MESFIDSPEEVIELCNSLHQSTQLKKSGRCIKFTNTIFNTDVAVDSWKFMDWDYGKDKIKLPIQARGLFTINDEKIAVRGYDKFFNVDEKVFTKVDELKKSTSGPYDVTLKENGCIVFISGLSNGDIIVCSKHSTGPRDNTTRNHALEGEKRLRLQLGEDKVKQLAKYLAEHNLTAVAELCDDEFEEHVLSYSKDKSGLYLHGLNYNTIQFRTVPIEKVIQFADDWNFKKVDYLTFTDVEKLFEFLEKCSETGKYQDREVEGFVIRCKRNNADFFFKYKFEQPYLLYRQFREVTRQLIIDDIPIQSVRMKKNKFITKKYLEFVSELFAKQPQLKADFIDGHGIIKVRELFLENLHETNGMKLLTIDESLSHELDNLSLQHEIKYVLVPVATIGCGKTTVFNTLSGLFPDWVHIQNDNIAKRSKLKIVDLTLMSLANYDVVLFDRNNSEYRERKQIFTTVDQKRHDYLDETTQIKYIAINFVHDVDYDQLWDITFERIKARGDNHQSIKSDSDELLATKVMKGFINRFQPLDTEREPDSGFDHVINLTLGENTSLGNVRLIIKELAEKYPELIPEQPTEEQISSKFTEALNYKPDYTKNMTNEKPKPVYYGVNIDHSKIIDAVNNQIGGHDSWQSLQGINRVQREFHVTLSHSANARGENKSKWKQIVNKLGKGEDKSGKSYLEFYADVKLTQVAITPDLICLKVDLLGTFDSDFNVVESEHLSTMLHITIGTFRPEVKPVESGIILQKLYADDSTLKPDGEYRVEGNTVTIVNFADESILEKQRLFVYK